MNIFKFGRGNFWGIVIPGGFLFTNIFIVFSSGSLQNSFSDKGLGYTFVLLSLLISYILGYIIRLIKPVYVELLSLPFQVVISIVSIPIKYISELLKLNSESKFIALEFKYIFEPFPYLNWFFEKHMLGLPKTFQSFYLELRKKEFNNDINKMNGLEFLNYAKRYVLENSVNLREELFFVEGLARFLNGMFYSIIFSLTLILTNTDKLNQTNYPMNLIYIFYLFILLVVLVRFKNIRRFESVMIFESYHLVCTKSYENNKTVSA